MLALTCLPPHLMVTTLAMSPLARALLVAACDLERRRNVSSERQHDE